MDRVSADHMGMRRQSSMLSRCRMRLEKPGSLHAVQSAIEMNQVAEPFIRRRAIRHLERAGS